ncbi:MAG: NosD domain-containing protein [Candidatus Heimdallarchaeaceae archaeon]
MKLNKLQLIIISSVIIGLILTLTLALVLIPSGPTEYIEHDPIIIWGDQDFEGYGFPGKGTAKRPYLIQNYEIVTDSSECIFISGTTKHFIIRNCKIGSDSVLTYFNGIYIEELVYGTTKIIENVCENDIRVKDCGGVIIKQNKFIEDNQKYHVDSYITYFDPPHKIYIDSSPECIISENQVGFITVKNSPGSVVDDNFLLNCGRIDVIDSDSCLITNNLIFYNRSWLGDSGLLIDDSFSCTIANNQFFHCGLKLGVEAVAYDYSFLLTIENNTINDKELGWFYDLNGVTISNPDYGQLFFINCSNITVSNQIISGMRTSIVAYSCENFLFSNNLCNDSEIGILVMKTNNSLIEQNKCDNNDVGIQIECSNNITVANNTLEGMSDTFNYEYTWFGGVYLPSENRDNYGITIYQSQNLSIKHHSINNKECAIVIDDSSISTISLNSFSNNSKGMEIRSSSYITVEENHCNLTSISIEDSDYTTITNNILENCYFIISGDTLDFYLSQTIVNNSLNGREIGYLVNQVNYSLTTNLYSQIFLINSTGDLISNQFFSDYSFGLGLYYCDNIELNNITCQNTYGGVQVYQSDYVEMNNISCEYTNIGIEIIQSNYLVVNNVTCRYSFAGITAELSFYYSISNSSFTNNEFGIQASNARNCTFINNTIANNSNGMEFYGGIYNIIQNNTISNTTKYGIYFYGLDFCLIKFNLIEANQDYGIYLSNYCYGIEIHHNAFIDNKPGVFSQAYDRRSDTNNKWYDEILLEGNFWNTWFSGSYDLDGSNNEDLYPLPTNPL